MQHCHRVARLKFLVLASILLAWTTSASAASKYKLLHSFGHGNDGAGIDGGVALAADGSLYGTTSGGGLYQLGTVWQLTPHANGNWSEKVLENFRVNDSRADEPSGTPIFDPAGRLYVTSQFGGGPYTHGTVFTLTPSSHGWKLAVIHRFGPKDKTGGPMAGVIRDAAGNLYGAEGCAFELSPSAQGWKETILHCFPAFRGDGAGVYAGLVRDSSGNLYGTTEQGGTSKNCGEGTGCGTAYRLHPLAGGGWQETILHDFGAPNDGSYPFGNLAMDVAGNLYGTTTGYNSGAVFELSPQSDGHWKETILHRFHAGSGGNSPGSVVFDAKGNLYGTTGYGGSGCNCGVLYELSPQANGTWKYTVLYQFNGYDGTGSGLPLIFDDKGNLYGTGSGGAYGAGGVVFEFTP
jgi:uncharacterized repeat protein (TIGR03803 family)